jgi:hypothetical protein
LLYHLDDPRLAPAHLDAWLAWAVDAAMERYIAALAPAGTSPPATEAAREQPPVARRASRGGSA